MRERSRFDWVELIEGILLILLGFYSISHPGSALTGVVLLYGLVSIVTGIADIVFYVKVEERGFKRNGRRDAACLSAGRHVDPHTADSDLVSCTLYFQALPSALCPDDGLENMVLHFTGDQYHRNHTWLPDDRKAVDHSDVGRLADLFLPDFAWC